ncbi:SCO7613 C-terminal domain-containing membrane protein [Cryobacterium serini]|uniref:DUF2157 domain-containing protein n=1 Tax=Cryobacterium serini TaxID=1259201 RepID=A0A4V3IXC7_9MICO|nr:hypothetical protein [Cryobacterium serini]TFD90062.1 hypothetical protein E3T51_05025 [Cryobacterium serini]
MQRRAELIGRIRYETETGRVAVTLPVSTNSVAASSVATTLALPAPTLLPVLPTAASAAQRSALPAAPTVFDPTARTRGPRAVVSPQAPALLPPDRSAAPALPSKPRRSSVQVVLLSIGVLLVSVAAIFFLTVAWIVAGLGFRFVVVALLTVAALVVAARMRRSKLTSTAEGIGSFAVVLVLLDVWGIRQNNLFGLAAADGPLYWGIALTVCAMLFLGWHGRSNLRVGSIAGFVVAVPGIGLFAAGLFQSQDTLTRVFVGFLGAAIIALLHRATLPRPTDGRRRPATDRFLERILLLALGALALVTAAVVAVFVESDRLIAPVWCLGAVALVATAHAVLVVRAPHSALILQSVDMAQPARLMGEYRAFAYLAASLAAFAAAGIAPVVAGRYDSLPFSLTVPVLVASALAVALELFARHLAAASAARTAGLVAAVSATIVAAIPLLLATGYAAWPLIQATANGLRDREVVPDLANADNVWALLALVGVGAILFIGWALGGLLRARRQIVTALGLAVVVLAVPFSPPIGVIVALYLLLGAGALIGLLLARSSVPTAVPPKNDDRGRFSLGFLVPAIITLLVAGETLGYVISWGHPTTWWFGTVSLVVALWFSRLLVTRRAAGPMLASPVLASPVLASDSRAQARGALLAAAIMIALVGVGHVPLALAPEQLWSDAINLANVTAAIALATALLHLLVAAAALWPTALSSLDRRWAFFALLVPTAIVFVLPIRLWSLAADESLLQPEPLGSILRAGILVAACALWVFLRANDGVLHWERAIAAIVLAPAMYLLVREILFATAAVTSVFILAAPAVALVVCSLALLHGTNRSGNTDSVTASPAVNDAAGATGALDVDSFARRDRVALEIGAAIVLVPALFTAVVTFRSLGWLVIVFAGIVALIMAIAPDGLFGSRSKRRHFGWLALFLGTAGLWLGLDRAGIVALEPYVLPVAGIVLTTAALIRRFGTTDRSSEASPVAGLLTFAGLLIALVPLAVSPESGSLVRPIVLALVSVTLMIGAALVRWAPPSSTYLAAAGLVGAIALVVTAFAQTQRLVGAPGAPDGRLELWLVLPAMAAITTAVLLVRQTDAETMALRRGAGIALVLAWASVLTWVEVTVVSAPADAGLSTPRAVLLVLALSAVHVFSLARPRAPLGAITAWSVLALAALAAITVASSGVVDPFELVTVPVAFALIGSGWLRLHSDPRARSWPWFGPGLLLLLVPSLLLDLTYNDLWRIVSLGVVAIMVLVIGSTRRLQAPFVIGAAVLLIHGVAQLWPWIALAYSVVPWFLWLGGGGILLIVLAARYEQRIANFKSVALRISALR